MINTPEYNLAKFLDKLMKPYLPKQYILDSTSHFIDKLKQFPSKEKQVMVSFDVVSLFTNVPLTETVNLIADCGYAETNDSIPLFTKDIFIKLMNLATKGLFLYKEVLYQQIDGVTMRSPLGPTLANFFMANLENKLLQKKSDANPKLYLRYVDDIFAIFEDQRSSTIPLTLSDVTNRSLVCIFLFPTLICIYCESLKVLFDVIQKLLRFGKFGFLTFDL